MYNYPVKYPTWAFDSTSLKSEMGLGKRRAGWEMGEKPPAHYWNWYKNLIENWTKYLDSYFAAISPCGRYDDWEIYLTGGNIRIDVPENALYKTVQGYTVGLPATTTITPVAYPDGEEGIRTDAIVLNLDDGPDNVSFAYQVDFDVCTGFYSSNLVALVIVSDYEDPMIVKAPRIKDFRIRAIYGDGKDSTNPDVVGLHSLQTAVNYLNMRGGGVVEVFGQNFRDWHDVHELNLKSNVIIDGIHQTEIKLGQRYYTETGEDPDDDSQPSYLIRLKGGKQYLSCFSYDPTETKHINCLKWVDPGHFSFFGYGIGTRIVINGSSDPRESGLNYIISRFDLDDIEDGNVHSVYLTTETGLVPNLMQEITDFFDTVHNEINNNIGNLRVHMLIRGAGLRNLTLRGNGLEPEEGTTSNVVVFDQTYDCFVENCRFMFKDTSELAGEMNYLYLEDYNDFVSIRNNIFCHSSYLTADLNTRSDSDLLLGVVQITGNIFFSDVYVHSNESIDVGGSGEVSVPNSTVSGIFSRNIVVESDLELPQSLLGLQGLGERNEHHLNGLHHASVFNGQGLIVPSSSSSQFQVNLGSSPDTIQFDDDGMLWFPDKDTGTPLDRRCIQPIGMRYFVAFQSLTLNSCNSDSGQTYIPFNFKHIKVLSNAAEIEKSTDYWRFVANREMVIRMNVMTSITNWEASNGDSLRLFYLIQTRDNAPKIYQNPSTDSLTYYYYNSGDDTYTPVHLANTTFQVDVSQITTLNTANTGAVNLTTNLTPSAAQNTAVFLVHTGVTLDRFFAFSDLDSSYLLSLKGETVLKLNKDETIQIGIANTSEATAKLEHGFGDTYICIEEI
ncbi:MAG TPA: hypothetical protein PKW95_20585 [bacterium]|nr:hypothetical protein [bacterium]